MISGGLSNKLIIIDKSFHMFLRKKNITAEYCEKYNL